VLAHRFDQAAGEMAKVPSGNSASPNRASAAGERMTKEKHQTGRQVSESGASASGTQRVDTCKAAAARTRG
jgi:hypothetical protein